jgi:invasion protein IalB
MLFMKWHAKAPTLTCLVMACVLLAGAASAAQKAVAGGYKIKPSDVAVPQDATLGKFRRIIHPFENWNLVCDENLQAKRKVCNISQSFVDGMGTLVFSWSLAASEDGKPFMILRVPAGTGAGTMVSLKFAGRDQSVNIKLDACDVAVCIGYVPVGPILRAQIGKDAIAQVSYSTPAGTMVSVDAPFKGLATALSAIN